MWVGWEELFKQFGVTQAKFTISSKGGKKIKPCIRKNKFRDVFKFVYLSKFSYKSVESYKLLRLQPGQRVKIQQQQKRKITYRQTGESISGVSD